MNKFKIVVLLCALFSVSVLNAQESEDNTKANNNTFIRHFYLSGDLGLDLLDGDNTEFKLGMDGNIGIGYQIDKYIGLKANIGYGGLNGSFKGISKYQDLSIEKLNYFEFSLNLTVDLTNIILGYNPDRKFAIVPHIGLGQIQYRASVVNKDGSSFYRVGFRDDKDIKESNSSINGRKVIATIPLGLEINYAITPRWNVYFDYTTNYTDSDFIEGIGMNENHDWFHTFNLGASYKLNTVELRREKEDNEYCNYWFATIDGGASFLFGDNNFNFSKLETNVNLGGGFNFRDHYRVYAKIGSGKYTGIKDNEWVVEDGNYLNASVNLSADVLGLIFRSKDNLRLGLYPHIGIGEMQYRATEKKVNNIYDIKQIGYDNDNAYNVKGTGINERRVALTFPLGIELVYNVNEKTDVYADATSYLSQSDLLDCVIDGSRNDAISTFNIGLRYKFNRKCDPNAVRPDNCLSPDEIKQAIQEAVQQQKAEEAAEEKPACMTPEEIKNVIKEAIEEYEASKPVAQENDPKYNSLSNMTVINNNFSDISFPKNGAEKVKTQTNIDAINRASDQVDNGSAVNRVIIEGYASPEGDKDFNERLALQRAEQAAEIIKNELGEIDQERIEITNKGADWEGLYASLENSDIEDKEMIIEELKNSSNQEETLQEILNKYPQIRQLLPQLRRASVVITTIK